MADRHRWKRPVLKLGSVGPPLVLVIARSACRLVGHAFDDRPWGRWCERCWTPEFVLLRPNPAKTGAGGPVIETEDPARPWRSAAMDLTCDYDDNPQIAYAEPKNCDDGCCDTIRVCAEHADALERETPWAYRIIPIASP